MTNKAIVFYTENKLTEEQELDIREKHGIENIIFVPVEDIQTITESNVLATTPQPYVIYNYVNDANIAIVICDKIMAYEKSNGISIPYFIGIEEPLQAETPVNIMPLSGVMKTPKEKLDSDSPKLVPRTHVMNPNSFMVSGVVLSDDVMFGFLFDDVSHCFIYTSSEKNLLSWFNAFIMNLTNSKREFPMLKAVIYAFEDERNQPMLGDDRDHQFVARHIYAALELFGKAKGVKIFKPTEVDEFKAYIALTEEELEQRTEMVKQAKQNDAIHVDVSNMDMPSSVKQIMDRLKRKPEERPDPHLSYGEAIEMCKKGIDVACVNWKADTFLTVNSGAYVHADNFWSPGNKRVAMSRPDKSMSVFPHFLRTDSFGTLPHMVDFNDQFSEWVVASDRVKVKNAKIDKTDGLDKLVLEFGLDTFSTPDFELAPFWIVYDVLAKLPNRATVIGDQRSSLLPHIVGSMKEAHQQRSNLVEESFNIDEDGIEGTHYDFRGVDFLCGAGLSETIESIRAGQLTDVILDEDSFKTDFRLDELKEALQEANVNWVTVSVKEQLFGISE